MPGVAGLLDGAVQRLGRGGVDDDRVVALRIMFWICAACSVTWFSAVVKASAAATMPSATACCHDSSQLFSIAWRQELPA